MLSKSKIKVLIFTSYFTVIILNSFHFSAIGNTITSPSASPWCEWSVNDGAKLVGPDAPLTVTWQGGDTTIVNNTLEFQVGYELLSISGIYNSTGEVNTSTRYIPSPEQVYKVYLESGYHYCKLTWDKFGADLNAYIYSDPGLNESLFGSDPWSGMKSGYWPEVAHVRVPSDGYYWIAIDFYSGEEYLPVNYQFFLGSDDYFYHENDATGPGQTFTTSLIPDNTYQVTASCYDAQGNKYSDTHTLALHNQFPPVLTQVWVNDRDVDTNPASTNSFNRFSDITINWQASDVNLGDKVFVNLYCERPGRVGYSTVFAYLIIENYTINWNMSVFERNGLYRFKLEVCNLNLEPIAEAQKEFYITITSSSTPPGTPGIGNDSLLLLLIFTMLVLVAIPLAGIPLVKRWKNK